MLLRPLLTLTLAISLTFLLAGECAVVVSAHAAELAGERDDVLAPPRLDDADLDTSVDCYREIDPYYLGFDVPSMIRVHSVLDADTVRQNLIHYLWKQDGWPGAKMPVAVQTLWKIDSLNCDCRNAIAPRELPGLVLWLDAADPTSLELDGNRVVGWKDKSGNRNDATQPTQAFRPTYDPGAVGGDRVVGPETVNAAAAVRFDGVDDLLSVPDNKSLDLAHATIFMVVQVRSGNNVRWPVPVAKLPTNSSYLFYIDGSLSYPSFRVITDAYGWREAPDAFPTSPNAELWVGWQDGDAVKFFRNDVEVASGTAPGTLYSSSGALCIGNGGYSAQNAFSGSIAELIVYNRAVPDSEREGISSYLECKYGIRPLPPKWTRTLGSSNLGRVDRLDIQMDYDLHSYAHLLTPVNGNNRLLIFHQGHADNILVSGGQETMRYFLDRGFSILAYSMPLYAENSRVARDVPGYGTTELLDHDQMAQVLENERGSFIRFFVEPVIVGINYAVAEGRYADVNMVGVSGGGWTTHLVAALDRRISESVPVAGSLPLYLRSGPCPNGSTGDSEQHWAPLYEDVASWLDLYILAGDGVGRGQLQVLNQFDDCCFGGVNYRTYEPFASAAVNVLGTGWFRVFLDSTHTDHRISNVVIETVIDPLLASTHVAGVDAGGGAGARATARSLEVRVRPNPSRGSAAIVYQIEDGAVADREILLDIYDLAGRLVRRFRAGARGPGSHTEIWDGRDASGRQVTPGVYLCRLQQGRAVSSSRIVLTR